MRAATPKGAKPSDGATISALRGEATALEADATTFGMPTADDVDMIQEAYAGNKLELVWDSAPTPQSSPETVQSSQFTATLVQPQTQDSDHSNRYPLTQDLEKREAELAAEQPTQELAPLSAPSLLFPDKFGYILYVCSV